MADTTSEEFKHQCLVRWVLKRRVDDHHDRTSGAKDFLAAWEQKHKASPDVGQLRLDVMSQWSRGNRGKDGDWRTGDAGV